MTSAGQAPKPPKFQKLNIDKTKNDAIAADIAGYDWSDNDFLSRFPGLVTGRQNQITDAYDQLNGPLDPTVQNSFVSQGVNQALGSFGGGNPFATLGDSKSGIGANTVAKSVANSVQGKQDSDRNYFESLIASNPQRAFGPSGGDIANWYITNSTGQNAAGQAAYAGNVSNYNAQNAASDANKQAAISAAVAIAAASLMAFSDKRAKENIKRVGTSPSGIPIKQFNYKGGNQKWQGVVAQDVEKIKPSAVVEDNRGMKYVRPSEIDVAIKRISGRRAA